MKIQVEVEIFDDPEYCQNKDGSKCCRFIAFNWDKQYKYCPVFDNTGLLEFDLPGDPWGLGTEKCDQCKAAYQKEQDKIVTDNPAADWVDNEHGLDRWEFSRVSVGDAFNAGVEYQKTQVEP